MQQNHPPVTGPPALRPEGRVERYLRKGPFPHVTREEYLRLVAATDDIVLRLIFQVLWTLGSRVSEALGLRACDLVREGAEYFLVLPRLKRRNALRERLPVPLELGIKLSDYLRLRGIAGEARLFPTTRVTVWRSLQRLGVAELGRGIHPHMFRHGRIYDLVREGEHPFKVARAVGHVNLQTTLGYYHPTDEDIRAMLTR